MTPAIATSTRVSLSGRRSRSGSPPSTRKYGDSVLSSGARSAPDGRCAAALGGTSAPQTTAMRRSVRSESVMPHQQGKRTAGRRDAETRDNWPISSRDHLFERRDGCPGAHGRVSPDTPSQGPIRDRQLAITNESAIEDLQSVIALVLHVLRHASELRLRREDVARGIDGDAFTHRAVGGIRHSMRRDERGHLSILEAADSYASLPARMHALG